jgi:hypothetical protein
MGAILTLEPLESGFGQNEGVVSIGLGGDGEGDVPAARVGYSSNVFAAPAFVSGSFASSIGPHGRGLAGISGVHGASDAGLSTVGFSLDENSFVEVSGAPSTSEPRIVSLDFQATAFSKYVAEESVNNVLLKGTFVSMHGTLAEGDTLSYALAHRTGTLNGLSFPVFDDFSESGTVTQSGAFDILIGEQHFINLECYTSLDQLRQGLRLQQTALLFIRINKGGSGTSSVAIDPGFTMSVPNEDAAVPEPATLTMWSLGALGCAIAAYRRKRFAM